MRQLIHKSVCTYTCTQLKYKTPSYTEIQIQILQLPGGSHSTFSEKEKGQLTLVSHWYFTVDEKEPLGYLLELGTFL